MLDIDTLKSRVRAGLSSDEYTDARYDGLYAQAIEESEGIVGQRVLPRAFWLDIAYFRFLTLVDSVDESDWRRYRAALEELRRAPIASDGTDLSSNSTASVLVARRKESWS